MTNTDMLDRLVTTLKRDIAPAIDDEYLKTQAFMASVVVGKLTRQLALEAAHRAAADADLDALLAELRTALQGHGETELHAAFTRLETQRDPEALCVFIEALYAARERIGEPAFERLRQRTRACLRADIDRRMEYAK